jgi:phosphoglycolate phosphatase
VLEVVTALKGQRERAVLVGDSQIDVTAARNAGIPVIVMSYGYTPVPVAELGADAIVDDFADLPAIISRLVS